MAGKSNRSGRPSEQGRIAGTSTKQSATSAMAQLFVEGAGSVGDASGPAFLRGNGRGVESKFRSVQRRSLLESSIYVGLWGPWRSPEGKVYTIDYGVFNWLRDCCITYEEVSGKVRGLPDGEYFDALCYVAARWQTEKLLAVPKSRRMIMSWLFRCLDTWDILLHPGRMLYVASEDLAKSEEMVFRTKFLIEHIPDEHIRKTSIPPLSVTSAKSNAGRKDLANRVTIGHSEQEAGVLDSFIEGLAQNDDLRGVGAGRITLEEFAKWKNGRAVMSGLLGTLIGSGEGEEETGGAVVLVSTAIAGSYMADLILDKLS